MKPIRTVVWSACVMLACEAAARADTLYVARRGWHIDVGFAVGELTKPLATMQVQFPGARYLFFGFGDRRYLLSEHRTPPVLLRALWPGPGLILATGLTAGPAAAFGAVHVIALPVSRLGSFRAQSFVWQAMTDEQKAALQPGIAKNQSERASTAGAPVGIPGPYPGSAFFDSRQRYSAIHTCNTWAAEVLADAGLPLRSGGVIFAGQLWRRVGRLHVDDRPGAGAADDAPEQALPH